MRVLVLSVSLSLALSACGPAPERVCKDSKCEQLEAILRLAEDMLAEHVALSSAQSAYDVRIEVFQVRCLEEDAKYGTCKMGEFRPVGGIYLAEDMLMLLHEGFHSFQWQTSEVMGHDWPQDWRDADIKFRNTLCPDFECS